MDRFERIYRLHGILSARRYPVPIKDIMTELECSQATAERSIKDLREYLAAPLAYDRKHNGYFYDHQGGKPYQLPGLWFSAEELNGLLLCHQLLQSIGQGILSEQIDEMQAKIDGLLSLQHQPRIKLSQYFIILSEGRRLKDDKHFKKIATALFNQKRIRIVYSARSGANETGERTISPLKLIYYRDNWYCVAYCHRRKAMRTFAIDGIGSVTTLDVSTERIDPERLGEFIGDSYGIFSGAARHLAILEFSPERAKWVADEQWHPEQNGRWLASGRYELSIPFSETPELVMDILKHGPDVEVKAPEFLREEVKAKIDAMNAIYQKKS